MLILAIDPGYRNLGVALVDTSTSQVLTSTSIDCGKSPEYIHHLLRPRLRDFLQGYPKPELVAMEAPPYGFGKGSSGGETACKMWYTVGGFASYAAEEGIQLKLVSPMGLKHFAGDVIGVPHSEWPMKGKQRTRNETKWGIGKAVKKLGYTGCETDHEDDAVLVAAWAVT